MSETSEMSVQTWKFQIDDQERLIHMNMNYSKHLKRRCILQVYTVDGFVTWKIIQDSFTTKLFEEFEKMTMMKVLALLMTNFWMQPVGNDAMNAWL